MSEISHHKTSLIWLLLLETVCFSPTQGRNIQNLDIQSWKQMNQDSPSAAYVLKDQEHPSLPQYPPYLTFLTVFSLRFVWRKKLKWRLFLPKDGGSSSKALVSYRKSKRMSCWMKARIVLGVIRGPPGKSWALHVPKIKSVNWYVLLRFTESVRHMRQG